MGRKSAPYWKASHNAWYCTISGRRYRLGEDRAEAEREFHRLMLAGGEAKGGKLRYTVADLADLYLEEIKGEVAEATWGNYRAWLDRWVQEHGRLKFGDLKPHHVTRWLKAHPTWGANTCAFAVAVLKGWSRWCRRSGRSEVDPLQDLRSRQITRRQKAEPGELERTVEAIRVPGAKHLVLIALATGCRPGELRTLTAAQVDLAGRTMVVVGKTGPRKVPIPEAVFGLVSQLCESQPSGPILRNSLGEPWTRAALVTQFIRARKRAGTEYVVPYTTRGHYATEALRRGVDSLLVCKILGHSDPRMLIKFYAQPDDAMLKEAAEKATRRGA